MPKFLNCQGVTYHLLELIDKAKERIVLISPFLRITDVLIEKLAYASNQRGITIFLVSKKGEMDSGRTIEKLSALKNIKIFEKENLHAKCYANEQFALITSLNLYEFSQQNNIEYGVLLDKDVDTEAFQSLKLEVNTLVTSSEKFQVLTEHHEKRMLSFLNYNFDLVKTRIALFESWRINKNKWSKESIDYFLTRELIQEIAYKSVVTRKDLVTLLKERPLGYSEIQELMNLFYFWKNFDILKVLDTQVASEGAPYDKVAVETFETKSKCWVNTKETLPKIGKMIATNGIDNGWLNVYYTMD